MTNPSPTTISEEINQEIKAMQLTLDARRNEYLGSIEKLEVQLNDLRSAVRLIENFLQMDLEVKGNY